MKKIVVVIMFVIVWIMTLFIEQITEEKLSYKEKILITLEKDFREFKAIPYRLKKDESFLKEALKRDGRVLKYLNQTYRANREWVLLAVKQNGMALEYASNMLKRDEEIVLEAVKENGNAFTFASQYLKEDRTYVLKLLKKEFVFVIDEVDKALHQDKDLVDMALAYDESAFKYVDETLQKDRAYIAKFLKSNGWLLAYLDESFQKDRELVTMAVMNYTYTLSYADVTLREDKDFLFSLIEKNDKVLEDIDAKVWKDNDFLLKVLKAKGFGLQYATTEQKNDRELVMKSIEYDAFSLEYASSELKKDKVLVLKALEDYSDPLKFADKSLRQDRAFITKAIEVNAFSITSINNALKSDRELVTQAVSINARVLNYLPKFQKDKSFIIEMIRRDINVLPYVDVSLKNDEDILKAVEEFPSKFENIELLLSWLAMALLFLFLYFIFIKQERRFSYLLGSILLFIMVEMFNSYFAHGVFRMPYQMVDNAHKFGLERTRCWAGNEANLSKLECYNMHVPEIHSDPKSRVITFPVRVYRSSEIFSSQSPVLHLGGGGPGAEMQLDKDYALDAHLEDHDAFSVNQGRDFFIIDPRGAGLSKPLLNCGTYIDNFLTNMKKELTLEESYKSVDSDYAECIEQFKKEGVNFNGYNSVAVSDDVHLLREAVGIDKWILFGVSYSTTYAIFVAKKYPEMVEKMVLDSACFPNLKLDHNYLVQKMDSYNALYSYKEKIKFQDLPFAEDINIKERMWKLHKKLNENPIKIDYLDLKVDGNYFISSLLEGVYGTKVFKDLPKIVVEMEENKTDTFLPYFEKHIDFLMDRSYSDVSAMAHYCYEDKPFIDFEKIENKNHELPKGYIQKNAILSFQANDFCKEMNITSSDKTLAIPIITEIPTLFIHGEFDSVTPLRDVVDEMKNFKNSKLLTYKTSHAVLGTEDKIEEDVAQFLTKSLNNVVK